MEEIFAAVATLITIQHLIGPKIHLIINFRKNPKSLQDYRHQKPLLI